MLPADAVGRWAGIRRLAPGALDNPAALDGGFFDDRDDITFAMFTELNGGAWSPGVYEISVTWAEELVVSTGTWYVELRPGPVQAVPRLLAAVRDWSRYAGRSGLILGTAEPLEALDAFATTRLLGIVIGEDGSTVPAGNGLGCEGPAIDVRPAFFGLTYGPHVQPSSSSTARAIFADGRSADEQPLLDTGAIVPGLRIMAPANGVDLPPATYRLTIGSGIYAYRMTVCLGSAPSDR
jgi:hypothetical protein